MEDARLTAAEAILDRGVRYNIPHAPVRYRLLGLHRIHIKPLRAGTILEISKVVLESKLEEAIMLQDHAFLSASLRPMAECIAIAVANGRLRVRIFRKVLTTMVLQLPVDVILQIFLHIESRNQKRLFLTITRYFSVLTQMMMDPRNLGQTDQGS